MYTQLASINPANLTTIRTYDQITDDGLARVLEGADAAFGAWRRSSAGERRQVLEQTATRLRTDASRYARLMAEEMGKPMAQGVAEAEKCAWACEHFAENAERYLADMEVPTSSMASFVTFRPLGVVLAVMPWNFPFWQVFRCAAPALAAGNVVVLKHASNVSGCALEIEHLFGEAGLPSGAFRAVLAEGARVAGMIDHPAVRAVALTGSVPAGRAVAARAGAALKKTVLELGGSDPYVVLADADLESAAAICAASRLTNSGQSCIAAKRFIVVESVAAEFERLFVGRMRAARVGDPLGHDTDVGPLARIDLRDELHEQVARSVRAGARLLLGGAIPDGPGAYYPPTVLADVEPGMAAFDEETFGPVAAIATARDEQEAIVLANRSSFGLGAAVFTGDPDRGRRIAATDLEAGSCFVNALVKSDPRLPFGGIKDSGYGRELGVFGIREFVNVKSVVAA